MPIALPEQFRDVLRAMGSCGGRIRAQKYTKEQLSEWGKRGGRPKKGARSKKNSAAASSPKVAADNPPTDSSESEEAAADPFNR
jgi:hypothetical protein